MKGPSMEKKLLPTRLRKFGTVVLCAVPFLLFIVILILLAPQNHYSTFSLLSVDCYYAPCDYPTTTTVETPEQVSSDFFSALASHNYGKAHSLLSRGSQSQPPIRELQTDWERLEAAHGTLQSYRADSLIAISGNQSVRVSGHVDFSN